MKYICKQCNQVSGTGITEPWYPFCVFTPVKEEGMCPHGLEKDCGDKECYFKCEKRDCKCFY